MNLSEITSPTLLLNQDIAKRNIRRMADRCLSEGIKFRPHFKTHQSKAVGEWFREAGISSISVSSVKMAYYFQSAGWDDITIAFPYNIRENILISELSKRVKLTITIPGKESALRLASMARSDIDIMIKIDTGYNRSGIKWDSSDDVSDIIRILSGNSHLRVRGLLNHSGDTYKAVNQIDIKSIYKISLERLNWLKESLQVHDLIISVGDTPSASILPEYGKVDELRPGNFVFYDLMQYRLGACKFEDIAVAMACPVVDVRPGSGSLVIYGGGVHFSKDHISVDGKSVYGKVVLLNSDGWKEFVPQCYLSSLSQEHGIINMPEDYISLFKPGDLIGVIPVHSCLTADLAGGYLKTDGTPADHMNEKKYSIV